MMQIIQSYKDVKEAAQNTVLVIGNFDGVHLGHQQLISDARGIADKKGAKLGVLSFEPHPRKLFRADDPPFRITPVAMKARRLEKSGIDVLFSLDFNWDFASQSAEDFIENILKQGLKPVHIVVGYDFCFGQLRKGTPETLKQAGFDVTVIDKIADEGDSTFSSSAIRTALRHGEIDKANELLGWSWEIEGIIVKGDQRGRELGFPTANVKLEDTLHPAYGVYAAMVNIEGEGEDDWRMAATNIGIRPMFEIPVGQVEAHILDFDRDIYGKTLRIRPVKKLRGEARFDNLEALIAQIERDCQETRKILGDVK